ncbi:DUF2188 domain-containing protein [Nocardioides sp. SYSU D00038]|uniref:DUF2188 domain-containing protein n=1 Tax=Nocardioides sp. SYSU D00038 TaxID=2812554 RepID=UPI001967038E|nr:DUF2188 domain-containing protein [Nocardioides sp. SYSU D00038]
MPQGDIETFHDRESGTWRNRIEGGGTIGRSHDRKDYAVEDGRNAARQRGVEHIVRNLDGTIGERDSHGHDPRDVAG